MAETTTFAGGGRGWVRPWRVRSLALVLLGMPLALHGLTSDLPSSFRTAVVEDHRLFRCPLHPDLIQRGPGGCPICGLRLFPDEPWRGGGRSERSSHP